MILLFTDFGHDGPYVGQMKAVLARAAPAVPTIDIMHDAPVCDPRRAAYLLAALARGSGDGDVWLAVVDPGVGGDRDPVVVDCDGVRFVGPDNGLFEIVRRRAARSRKWRIAWRPPILSESFHGRDLFAPVAARLALGDAPPGDDLGDGSAPGRPGAGWPDELSEIVYVDRFGNLMTGLDGTAIDTDTVLSAGGRKLGFARTFSDARRGEAFWYVNSSGLVEIAANQENAAALLGLGVGDSVACETQNRI